MAEPYGCGYPIVVVEKGDTANEIIEVAESLFAADLPAIVDRDGEELFYVLFPNRRTAQWMTEIDLRNFIHRTFTRT